MNARRAALLESLGFSLSVIDGDGENAEVGGGGEGGGDLGAVGGESHRRVPTARSGGDGKSSGRQGTPVPLEFQFRTGFPEFYKEIPDGDDGFSCSDSEVSSIDEDMAEADKNNVKLIDSDSATGNLSTHQDALKTHEAEKSNLEKQQSHNHETEEFDPVKGKLWNIFCSSTKYDTQFATQTFPSENMQTAFRKSGTNARTQKVYICSGKIRIRCRIRTRNPGMACNGNGPWLDAGRGENLCVFLLQIFDTAERGAILWQKAKG